MEILKDKIYTVEDYKFVNFTQLDRDTIEQIRLWRNHPDIRKYMYNSDEISEAEHLAFVNSLQDRTDKFYWLVYKNDKPLGVINLVKVDVNEESAESGFYVLPEYMDSGIGLEFTLKINYFFFSLLQCKLIHGSMEEGNINARMLNTYLGCRLKPGIFIYNGHRFVELEIHSDSFIKIYKSGNHARNFLKHIKNLSKHN